MAREAMGDVIVLLPGITGSVLKKDGKTVWGYSARSIGKALFTGGKSWIRDLALPNDDPDTDDLGDGVEAASLMPDLHLLPGLWKIDGYTRIRKSIAKNFEVTEGVNYFEFPYDWRRDNRVAARRLRSESHSWLKAWREKSGNADARLMLLAHSMGGLVSRYFLECMEGWKDTRLLITFGTPYRGSPNAIDGLANGIKKGPLDISDLGRQFTSIYQLMPRYECYDNGDGVLVRVGETTNVPNIDPVRAAEALAFHRQISDAQKTNEAIGKYRTNGYRIVPVVGIAQDTYQSAVKDGDRVRMLKSIKGKDLHGDGTVPFVSAIPIEMSDQKERATYAGTKHGSLQNGKAVLRQLEGILMGLDVDLGEFRLDDAKDKRPSLINLAVEDIYWKGEPIEIKAGIGEQPTPLTAEIWEEDKEQPTHTVQLDESDDGWVSGTIENVPAGSYSVVVSGEGRETAADAFAVVDLEEGAE